MKLTTNKTKTINDRLKKAKFKYRVTAGKDDKEELAEIIKEFNPHITLADVLNIK
jgi:hypothetical protein